MRKTINKAVGETIKDLLKNGIGTSFSESLMYLISVRDFLDFGGKLVLMELQKGQNPGLFLSKTKKKSR